MRDEYSGHGASRMPVDVGQALLHYAKYCRFQVARQPAEILRNLQVDGDLAAFGKSPYVPGERGGKTSLVEQRRVQEGRDCPDVPAHVADKRRAARNYPSRLRQPLDIPSPRPP